MFLGEIEHMDTVWVNGVEVGGSGWVENPRVYFIPPGVLKPGKNIVTIRVFKSKPDGGFLGKPDELISRSAITAKSRSPATGRASSVSMFSLRSQSRIGFQNWPVIPSVLYEGMLAPIGQLSISGAIWYQGEENSTRGYEYRKVLPVMIADWRKLFDQGNFPFYIVSLPAFMPRSATPDRRRLGRYARVTGVSWPRPSPIRALR